MLVVGEQERERRTWRPQRALRPAAGWHQIVFLSWQRALRRAGAPVVYKYIYTYIYIYIYVYIYKYIRIYIEIPCRS